jgi:hypothetical protein
MKLFFSGIASESESKMLAMAGVTDLLVDPTDWANLRWRESSSFALDSGAYRAWKKGTPLDLEDWKRKVDAVLCDVHRAEGMGKGQRREQASKLRFVTMPDVFGDPAATYDRWRRIEDQIKSFEWDSLVVNSWHDQVIPVWQWGAPIEHLEEMVAWAERATKVNEEDAEGFFLPRADLIAIGGCVPWMRANDAGALAELVELSRKYGKHFHILGLNWLEAMMQLDPLVRSCDTSKWLDGARYGTWINDVGGKLVVEAKMHCPLGDSRTDLCRQTAITLDGWCNKGLRNEETLTKRKVSRKYTLRKFEAPENAKPVNQLLLAHGLAENKKRHEEAKENYIEARKWRK